MCGIWQLGYSLGGEDWDIGGGLGGGLGGELGGEDWNIGGELGGEEHPGCIAANLFHLPAQ